MAKGSLPLLWKSNPKDWITQAIFQDWFFHHFIPEVEKYCLEKNIPFNILLLLGNVLGHPPFMDDFHPNVRVVHLTRNTMSVIRNNFVTILEGLQHLQVHKKHWRCLAWGYGPHHEWGLEEPLPAVHNFRGFEKVDQESKEVVSKLVTLSEKLELDLQEDDFMELLAVQHEELTNEDLMELEAQRKDEERQEEEEVTEELKRFTMQEMARRFSLFEEALLVFEAQDQNVEW